MPCSILYGKHCGETIYEESCIKYAAPIYATLDKSYHNIHMAKGVNIYMCEQ